MAFRRRAKCLTIVTFLKIIPEVCGTLRAVGDGRGGSANAPTPFVPQGVPHMPQSMPQFYLSQSTSSTAPLFVSRTR